MRDGAARRVVLASFGSLGDLHPTLALAGALARRGHRPRVVSLDRYAGAVRAAGLEFAPMAPGEAELGDPEALVRRLFHPQRGPEFMVRGLLMPHLRRAWADFCDAAGDADAIVSHPLTFAATLYAEKHRLPWASTVLAPMSLLSCEDPPLIASAPFLLPLRRLGVGPYRAVWRLMAGVARHWERPLAELRAELGLPPAAAPALFDGQYAPRLNLALFSPRLAEPADDWPPATRICGFPFHDGPPPEDEVLARLHDFLGAGDPPLVFALGSSVVLIAGDFWTRAIEASRRLGCRALLLTGRPTGSLGPLPGSARDFEYLPYSRVFPHARAVIHQAGIGTLAQALAAGRPQLAVPVAFDQPDNAARAARLGVARVLPFRKADTPRLTEELDALLNGAGAAGYRKRARDLGPRVRAEDGAERAADWIESLLL